MVKPGLHTLHKLRNLYTITWGHDWPQDDLYLKDLWREAREATDIWPLAKRPSPKAFAFCLDLMRENQ